MAKQKFSVRVQQAIKFVKQDLWKIPLTSLPKGKAFLYKQIRILYIAIQGFTKDECGIRASALTFFSFLSIVPVLATAFGIAKGFGLDNYLKRELNRFFAGHEDIMEQTLTFANNMLDTADGGLISGISIAFLLYAVLKLFNNIEEAFNRIWEVKKSRSWDRKFSDYTAIVLIAPILIILSSSMTVFVNTQVEYLTEQITLLGWFKPAIMFPLRFLPTVLLWLVFSLLYSVMPNTNVNVKSAIVGGIIAGTSYELLQWGYINFQVGVSRYNAIYGSFAALPLFFIWLQLSWMIVLFGAEYAFAHQHASSFFPEEEQQEIGPAQQRKLALLVVKKIVQRFKTAEKPYSADELANEIGAPYKLIIQQLQTLEESHLIAEVVTPTNEPNAYQPAVDIDLLTVHYVITKLDKRKPGPAPVNNPSEIAEIESILQAFDQQLAQAKENKRLSDFNHTPTFVPKPNP